MQTLVTAFTLLHFCSMRQARLPDTSNELLLKALAIAFGSQQKDWMLQNPCKTKVDMEDWTD